MRRRRTPSLFGAYCALPPCHAFSSYATLPDTQLSRRRLMPLLPPTRCDNMLMITLITLIRQDAPPLMTIFYAHAMLILCQQAQRY